MLLLHCVLLEQPFVRGLVVIENFLVDKPSIRSNNVCSSAVRLFVVLITIRTRVILFVLFLKFLRAAVITDAWLTTFFIRALLWLNIVWCTSYTLFVNGIWYLDEDPFLLGALYNPWNFSNVFNGSAWVLNRWSLFFIHHFFHILIKINKSLKAAISSNVLDVSFYNDEWLFTQ